MLNWQLLNLFPKEDDPQHTWYAPGDDLSAFSGKDSMFVSRVLAWYVEEVQTSLQSGDWTKPDEIVGMISTYQQAKNKIAGVTSGKMEAEIKYNRLDVFSQCKKGYLIFGGLLLVFAFASYSACPLDALGKSGTWCGCPGGFLSIRTEWGCAGILQDMLHGAIHMNNGLRCLGYGFCRLAVRAS